MTREDLKQDRKQVEHDQKKLDTAEKYGSHHEVTRRAGNLADSKAQLQADHQQFDAGLYTRPADWTDHAWAVGERLPADYYGETYWVEPTRYKLVAPADGGRWVRVDHDVVRIGADGTVREIRSGWFR